MTTIIAIYAAGALFFLLQAYLYAKVSRERIIGALTWPVLLFIIPHVIYFVREANKITDARLRYDERAAWKSMKIGDRWGIGA